MSFAEYVFPLSKFDNKLLLRIPFLYLKVSLDFSIIFAHTMSKARFKCVYLHSQVNEVHRFVTSS